MLRTGERRKNLFFVFPSFACLAEALSSVEGAKAGAFVMNLLGFILLNFVSTFWGQLHLR
jgi:hypothetical protein